MESALLVVAIIGAITTGGLAGMFIGGKDTHLPDRFQRFIPEKLRQETRGYPLIHKFPSAIRRSDGVVKK